MAYLTERAVCVHQVDWEEFLFWWRESQKPSGKKSAFGGVADMMNQQMSKAKGDNQRRMARCVTNPPKTRYADTHVHSPCWLTVIFGGLSGVGARGWQSRRRRTLGRSMRCGRGSRQRARG